MINEDLIDTMSLEEILFGSSDFDIKTTRKKSWEEEWEDSELAKEFGFWDGIDDDYFYSKYLEEKNRLEMEKNESNNDFKK